MQDAFDRLKDQIGACGIWCGSCGVGNGAILELSQHLEDALEDHGVKHWAPADLDYEAFIAGLETIRKIASCPGCRDFGGRENCEMKACTVARAISECAECGDRDACPHGEVLEHMRTGALDAGLFVRAEAGARQELLRQWTKQLRTRWPSCALFIDEASA